MANFFLGLFTSIFKFPIFKLIIAMILNNSISFRVRITFVLISSIDFGVLVCVIGFLDLFTNDPISCTNLLPNSNSNGNLFLDPNLLIGTCSSNGLNFTKEGYISTLSICNLIAYRPSYVYCCVAANVVVNVGNVLNFQWSPSNLHIHPHQSTNVFQLKKTLCHVPF